MTDEFWQSYAPARFRDAHTDDLDGPLAAAFAVWRDTPRRNWVMLGAVGTGKTHAAAAVLRRAFAAGWSGAFWPVVELLDAMRPGGDGSVYDHCTGVDLLVLDDLGSERPTDWTAERLYALVNRRWLEERPIVVTSNLSAAEGKGPFVDAVGPRMYSRLVHGAVVTQVAGMDRRRR